MRQRSQAQGGRGREGGQTIVEFALVAALLFILLFAIIDFARLFFAYATMSNGVRDGARYGIAMPMLQVADPAPVWVAAMNEITETAKSRMVVVGGTTPTITATTRYDDGSHLGCNDPHLCQLHLRASTRLDMWTPLIPSIDIVAEATMHFE